MEHAWFLSYTLMGDLIFVGYCSYVKTESGAPLYVTIRMKCQVGFQGKKKLNGHKD